MKRLTYLLAAVFVGGGLLALDPIAQAGQTARPQQTVVYVPASQSVFLDVPFEAGRAIATISANNNSYFAYSAAYAINRLV